MSVRDPAYAAFCCRTCKGRGRGPGLEDGGRYNLGSASGSSYTMCKDCEGTGKEPTYHCPKCQGTGYHRYYPDLHGKPNYSSVASCMSCGGSGWSAATKILAERGNVNEGAANERQVGGDHYRKVEGEQHWDRAWRLYGPSPFQYQITKYVERYRDKGGIQDLEKAAHFLQKLIELERGREQQRPPAATHSIQVVPPPAPDPTPAPLDRCKYRPLNGDDGPAYPCGVSDCTFCASEPGPVKEAAGPPPFTKESTDPKEYD